MKGKRFSEEQIVGILKEADQAGATQVISGRHSSVLVSFLVAALMIVGISEPLGVLLAMPRLRALGRLTSASNSPLVFNQVGGIEFWANRYSIELVAHDGSVSEMPVTHDVLSRIRGPHTRTAAYVVPVGLSAVAPPEIYLPPLVYGLCRHGPLAQDFGFDGDLAIARIHVRGGSPGDERQWTTEISCAR